MKIFLSGHVPKGKEEEKEFINWRINYQKVLYKLFKAKCIDPFDRNLDESDFFGVVGADCQHIKQSDLVIINAETQLGAGTAQEIIIAKYFTKPVVTVLPKNSYHRRSNIIMNKKKIVDWIHPFIFTFSDLIIENIEGIENINLNKLKKNIKDISMIDKAVDYVKK